MFCQQYYTHNLHWRSHEIIRESNDEEIADDVWLPEEDSVESLWQYSNAQLLNKDLLTRKEMFN